MRFFIQFLASVCLLAVHIFGGPVVANAQEATAKLDKGVLRVGVATAAKQLNPALAVDAASARIVQLTHPALLAFDASYGTVGVLAEKCEQPSPLRVVCTLPQGRTWVDGRPMKPEQVATWLRDLKSNPRSPLNGLLKNVKDIGAQGQTVVLVLDKPQGDFAEVLVQVPIANPETALGAGPYRVLGTDVLGTVTLATSRTDIPSKIELTPVTDHTVRLLKLRKGDLDVLYNDIPPELFAYARKEGFPALSVPGTSYGYLLLNWRDELLRQPAVRQALALGIDRALIRKTLLAGLAEPAGTILPQSHPLAWNAPEEPRDIVQAGQLLTEAAYLLPDADGLRAQLVLTTSTDPFSQRVAQAIQYQLRQIGIAVVLRPMEWGGFYAAVQNGQVQMALLAWSGEQTPEFYHRVFNSKMLPPAGFNRGHVNDREMDQLTDAYMAATDKGERGRLAIAIQQRQAQVLPYIPLYRRHHTLVVRPGIVGCGMPGNGSLLGLLGCRKTAITE